MYELTKSFQFAAGHSLEHHDGLCKKPHGHTYTVVIHLETDTLVVEGPKKNMVMDFKDLSAVVKPMIKTYFDHQWLNDTLDTDSPSTEFIAKWIFDFLITQLPLLKKVTVQESPTSSITYTKTN